MDERRALIAAIIANPDEDTPRSAFADWLQENGGSPHRPSATLGTRAGRIPRLLSAIPPDRLSGRGTRFAADSGRKVENILVSSNVSLMERNPKDAGVAVYFTWDGISTVPARRITSLTGELFSGSVFIHPR